MPRVSSSRALEQASRWIARQGADDYDAVAEADFAAWYGAAAENARAYEQIRNSIAYVGANVKFGLSHSGLSVG